MNRGQANILSIHGLSGGYTKGHDILQCMDLEVESGQAIGIIGLNGSGKSTLAKAIMNTLPYRKGAIMFNGKDISHYSTRQLSDEGIAMFLQGGRVFDELSVWENCAVIAGNGLRHIEILNQFPLLQNKSKSELKKIRTDRLSGGERHQLALVMCLLKKPKIIILDEPSAGLSPVAVDETYRILKSLKDDKELKLTIILIEQNMAQATAFCDSIKILQNGKVTYCSSNKDIKEIENIMFSIYSKANNNKLEVAPDTY